MFEPDVLLPEQFRALQGKVLSAEQRLLLAILEDAVHCYQMYARALRPRDRQIFRDAEEWFESTDTQWFFSFENVCSLLSLNADYLRRAIRRWKAVYVDAETQQRMRQVDSYLSCKALHRARSV